MSRPNVAEKRRQFHQLHGSGCFVIPNPWDIGSARLLQSLGFKALASTSSGFAWSRGYPDGPVSRDQVLAHLAELVAATDVPLNADFQNRTAWPTMFAARSRPGWRACR
jgi:2-methylisocitrate lyase-like PEP mutase family enzyme